MSRLLIKNEGWKEKVRWFTWWSRSEVAKLIELMMDGVKYKIQYEGGRKEVENSMYAASDPIVSSALVLIQVGML